MTINESTFIQLKKEIEVKFESGEFDGFGSNVIINADVGGIVVCIPVNDKHPYLQEFKFCRVDEETDHCLLEYVVMLNRDIEKDFKERFKEMADELFSRQEMDHCWSNRMGLTMYEILRVFPYFGSLRLISLMTCASSLIKKYNL